VHNSEKEKTHSLYVERMGSPVDNLGRHISFSSDGLSTSLLLSWIPRLLGYPLMEYVSQDTAIIAFLGRIIKFSTRMELISSSIEFFSLS